MPVRVAAEACSRYLRAVARSSFSSVRPPSVARSHAAVAAGLCPTPPEPSSICGVASAPSASHEWANGSVLLQERQASLEGSRMIPAADGAERQQGGECRHVTREGVDWMCSSSAHNAHVDPLVTAVKSAA